MGSPHHGVILDGPCNVLTARVSKEFSATIDRVATALGMSKSELVRSSIRALYSAATEALARGSAGPVSAEAVAEVLT